MTELIFGLVVILINPANLVLKGVALGLLIFGTVGHTTEVFSMRKNKAYYEAVVGFTPYNPSDKDTKKEEK